jgi:hypothetical protein
LNFKIIPSELESLGKKVCVDDHGSVFTKAVIVNSPSTSGPAHKKVKQENKLSPKAKQNLFENVDVGDISETFGIDSLSLDKDDLGLCAQTFIVKTASLKSKFRCLKSQL